MKLRAAIKTLLALGLAVALLSARSFAATFSGNASIAAGGGNSLSAAAPNNAITISCWFRMVVPTGTNLTENIVILMDRADGDVNATFSYLIQFNIDNGSVEFLTRGANGAYTNTLIVRPFLDRWYHVAIARQNNSFSAYVDGRALTPDAGVVGTANGSGLSIGGVSGTSRLFRGDITEVAIYQATLSTSQVQDRMFKDQRAFANLKGYFKLAYSTNSDDRYHNFAPSPPAGTDPATKQGSGVIDFEETDQAGEQSLFDSRKNHGQDALTPLSGAFDWSQSAFARAAPGIAFDFQFGYSSATPATTPIEAGTDPYDIRSLGPGWRHTFDIRMAPEQDSTERRMLLWNGSIETWFRTNTIYRTRHREYRGELVLLPDFDFEWTTPARLIYHFHDPTDGTQMAGRLTELRDLNGNRVQLLWNEGEGYVTNVIDTAGGRYTFNYDTTANLLTNLSFGAWRVNFGYTSNRLTSKSITNTSGLHASISNTWQFAYSPSNGLLQAVIDPRGNTNVFVQYDQYGRKTNEMDAIGRATQTRYGVPGKRQITHIDPTTNSWVETYDRKGRILSQRDPLLNETSYTYDDAGNRTSITEPLGWKTFFGCDERANVIARTNALGEVTRWNYHSFFNKATNEINPLGWTNSYVIDDTNGNLLRHFDDLGTLVSYTYASNGLVLTSTDANTNTTRFAYDTNGFLIARTDPATNTTRVGYNEVGWKLAQTNALNQRTTFDYDLNGNVVRTVDPLQRVLLRTVDANGNVTSEYDAKGNFTSNIFDIANQKISMTDRTRTNITAYFYNSRGKLERVSDQ